MNKKELALEICLNEEMSAQEKFDSLQDLGYDLEDMFEICLESSELETHNAQ